MSDFIDSLPESGRVSVPILSRIFKVTTTSYKYLFLWALLKLLKNRNFSSHRFELVDIAKEMLILAWHPHTYFKLSFGLQDKIAQTIDSFEINSDEVVSEKHLRMQIPQDSQYLQKVLRFVPFRLLAVFFENELNGIKDGEKNNKIKLLSRERFNSVIPLYRFVNEGESIELHPAWKDYLTNSYAIVEGWLLWQWQNYLQDKNPNVPAITKKMFLPKNIASLTGETKYWREIMGVTPLKCIYSNTKLPPNNLSLDHFLPWSFVGHNQLWNLIPTSQATNSAKGNRLPSLDDYLDQFIQLQLQGITISKEKLTRRQWEKKMECYIVDLRINDFDSLCNERALIQAYKDTIIPLYIQASRIGFFEGWTAIKK